MCLQSVHHVYIVYNDQSVSNVYSARGVWDGKIPQMTPQPFKCPKRLLFLHGPRCGTPTAKIHRATLSIAASSEDTTKGARSDGHEARITDSRNQRFPTGCLAAVWASPPPTLSKVFGAHKDSNAKADPNVYNVDSVCSVLLLKTFFSIWRPDCVWPRCRV